MREAQGGGDSKQNRHTLLQHKSPCASFHPRLARHSPSQQLALVDRWADHLWRRRSAALSGAIVCGGQPSCVAAPELDQGRVMAGELSPPCVLQPCAGENVEMETPVRHPVMAAIDQRRERTETTPAP